MIYLDFENYHFCILGEYRVVKHQNNFKSNKSCLEIFLVVYMAAGNSVWQETVRTHIFRELQLTFCLLSY